MYPFRRGQNTLEYVVLAAVVITIVVMGAGSFFSKMRGENGAFNHYFDNMRTRIGVNK